MMGPRGLIDLAVHQENPPLDHYRPRRVFNLKEANQTLPLVMRITRDIVAGHREISDLDAQAHHLKECGKEDESEELKSRIQDLLQVVDGYVEELEKIGCEYKDRTKGLVDFPARMGNRLVYLCWKMGEPEVLYWHELHAGFAGRKPIDHYFTESLRG